MEKDDIHNRVVANGTIRRGKPSVPVSPLPEPPGGGNPPTPTRPLLALALAGGSLLLGIACAQWGVTWDSSILVVAGAVGIYGPALLSWYRFWKRHVH